MEDLKLWQLAPSFNSRKVRFALGAKGATYEVVDVTDADTARVVEVSGQPMTPVLQHGDRVMFDSGAIVRYIDANLPGPRLFSPDLAAMRAIEAWESRARVELLAPYLKVAGEVRSGRMDAAAIAEGREGFMAGAATVEAALGTSGFLVGDGLTGADIFCGCYLAYGFLSEAEAGSRPPLVWAREHLALAASFPRLADWYEELRKLDTIPR